MAFARDPSDIHETFIIEPLSITGGSPTLSACTGMYTNNVISCSGDTNMVMGSGYTEFSHDIIVNGSITGDDYYSGSTALYDVILSAITNNDVYVTGATFSGSTLIISRRDDENILATFTGNTSGDCITDLYVTNIFGCTPIILHNDIEPVSDDVINLGTALKRFRDINTVSGSSTVWTSSISVSTPSLMLGVDSSGNTRTITANNSIIQHDKLNGGGY